MDTNTEPTTTTKFPWSSLILSLLLAIPLGLLVGLILTGYQAGVARDAPQIPEPGEQGGRSYPAPGFQINTLEGKTVTLEDYEGQVLFLNFWQTTCLPCVRELPTFEQYLESQEDDSITVLAVSFDETSAEVNEFLDEIGVESLPIALDPTSRMRRSYGVEQIPTTFVIDPEGVVQFQWLGEMTFLEMISLADEILYSSS